MLSYASPQRDAQYKHMGGDSLPSLPTETDVQGAT